MTDIQIHTLDWHADTPDYDGDAEPATASLYCVVEIDGRKVEGVISAITKFGNEFSTVTLEIAGNVEITHHTMESWKKISPVGIGAPVETAKNGADEVIASGP